LFSALRQQFGNERSLRNADLAAIDGFHIRGKRATVLLAEKLGELSEKKVLDIGCAIGGSARFLAEKYCCQVTGVDITPSFIDIANELAKIVNLSNRLQFICGSALELPFSNHQYDVVWMEHVQMNIADKAALLGEIRRVLRSGGHFVFHEIFAADSPLPHFPVPWASSPNESYLVTVSEFKELLSRNHFHTVFWENVTQQSTDWIAQLLKRLQQNGLPPLGIHLLMGNTATEKLTNLSKNLSENKLCVIQAIVKAGD
jgi:ubiquinone/menaquinone biosynthesis C-methylase UbiE